MYPALFSRLPVALARIFVVLALLPGLGGIQTDSHSRPLPANPVPGLPPGWTAGEWDQVVGMVQADLSAGPARQAGTWAQKKKLVAEDAEHQVGFGYSVAVDRDTLVVGAENGRILHETYGRINCGTVYVFEKGASGWSGVHQVAKLYPTDYVSIHTFGWSVAIDGNYMVVGAPDSHKPWAGTPGAAYLFQKTAGGWEQVKKLATASPYSGTTPPRFGFTVDIDGDLIVVGAPMEDLFYDGTLHSQQGSVYVFQTSVGDWSGTEVNETAILTPADGRAGDMFGASVTVSGHNVIAGAYGHEPDPDNPAQMAYGKVYVFSHSDPWGNANDVARFTASDAADHEYFGWSVAIDGDLAVVGAPGETSEDNNGEESVYLFERPVGGWSGNYTETARLVASDDNMIHDLGVSVAVSGGVVVAGAPWWDPSGGYSKIGAAYVFTKPAGGWVDGMTESQRLLADDREAGDEFGHHVAIDGTALAVGAPWENGRFGAAYVFDSAPVSWLYVYLPLIVR